MANASAQLEDLLGDYLTLGSNTSSGEAYTNHSTSATLADVNSNWGSGYVKIALATDATLGPRFSSYAEVSGGNYSRAADDANSSGHIAIVPNSSTNGTWENQYKISFPQASASWGTVTWAIFQLDDGSNDFPLIACPIINGGTATNPTGVAVGNNTTLTFNAGDLSFTIA